MSRITFRAIVPLVALAATPAWATVVPPGSVAAAPEAPVHAANPVSFVSMLFVFMLATFIGLGVIRRVSRLLHTPLMSLTNAISAIAVIGSIMVAGGEGYPTWVRAMGAVALFCSMTNIVSGFMITDRMLKMFQTTPKGGHS
jgi:NAD(P) transhydrogenase subunit alpha